MFPRQYWPPNFFQKKLSFVTGVEFGCTVIICLFGLKPTKTMKKQTILKITNDDGTSETIKCYLQRSQLFKVQNSANWKGRYKINCKRKWFSSPKADREDAWRDINKQINDLTLNGKRAVIKRNVYP